MCWVGVASQDNNQPSHLPWRILRWSRSPVLIDSRSRVLSQWSIVHLSRANCSTTATITIVQAAVYRASCIGLSRIWSLPSRWKACWYRQLVVETDRWSLDLRSPQDWTEAHRSFLRWLRLSVCHQWKSQFSLGFLIRSCASSSHAERWTSHPHRLLFLFCRFVLRSETTSLACRDRQGSSCSSLSLSYA